MATPARKAVRRAWAGTPEAPAAVLDHKQVVVPLIKNLGIEAE